MIWRKRVLTSIESFSKTSRNREFDYNLKIMRSSVRGFRFCHFSPLSDNGTAHHPRLVIFRSSSTPSSSISFSNEALPTRTEVSGLLPSQLTYRSSLDLGIIVVSSKELDFYERTHDTATWFHQMTTSNNLKNGMRCERIS